MGVLSGAGTSSKGESDAASDVVGGVLAALGALPAVAAPPQTTTFSVVEQFEPESGCSRLMAASCARAARRRTTHSGMGSRASEG